MTNVMTHASERPRQRQRYDTIVIGGGQAGLAVGYYLKQQGRDFIILDAAKRTGDVWRARWDSLRLFTPAKLDALPGMAFPAPPDHFPHKDEMADYLEAYVRRFDLPVQLGTWVSRLTREGDRYIVEAGGRRFEAANVIVAVGTYQVPWTPPFADDLDPGIRRLHSAEYRNPGQLQDGPVLVVGAGNSGSEIGLEVARTHQTYMSGRDVGHIPFRIERRIAHWLLIPLVLRGIFHRLLTVDTPIGRKARPKLLKIGGPLVRVKPSDLTGMGIERLPKVAGVRDGKPVMEDGRVLDVANVIWCTGFRPNFSWIDLPIFGGKEDPREPVHERGVVEGEPGLYFVGLFFLYALSSSIITGVARDAKYVADTIAAREAAREPAAAEAVAAV